MAATEQSTFDYLGGQAAGPGTYLYMVQNTGTVAYSDARILTLKRLSGVDALYNATGWQAQLLRADGSAAGPVRGDRDSVNDDIVALFAEGPQAFYVVRVTLSRIDAADVAGANFTFSDPES